MIYYFIKSIIVIAAIIHLIVASPFFVLLWIVDGLTNANRFMNDIAINWMKAYDEIPKK